MNLTTPKKKKTQARQLHRYFIGTQSKNSRATLHIPSPILSGKVKHDHAIWQLPVDSCSGKADR